MTDTMKSYHHPLVFEREYTRYFYNRGDNLDKAGKLTAGDYSFFAHYSKQVRHYSVFPFRQNGCPYEIHVDPADAMSGIKKMAVHEAVRIVTDRGFKLPETTRFYLVGDKEYDVKNQAYHFDEAGKPVCLVTLGPSAPKGGSGRGISAQATPGFAPATKIVLHELGHTFHAHNVGRVRFFTDPRLREISGGIGLQVSEYAGTNIAKEIIAEAFLGMMIGRQYGDDVVRYYAIKGGPRVLQSSGQDGFGVRAWRSTGDQRY